MSNSLLMSRARMNHATPLIKTKSLLHFDGTNSSTSFIDESGKIWTAAGSAQISTAQAVFGQSGSFNGTNSYITSPYSTDFDFATADFSIEMFLRLNSLPSSAAITMVGNYFSNDGWELQYRTDSGGDRLQFGIGDSTVISKAWSPSTNTWYHIACCRVSGVVTFYVAGTALAAGVSFPNSIVAPGSSNAMNIGALSTGGSRIQYVNGYIDELRIKNGQSAYSANFTPPAAPFIYP